MNSNVIHFKAFLRSDGNCEARRFFIEDPSVVTNFEYMKEKLRMVYPVLRDTIFRVTWKDEDGDEITITCDEDLLTAITEMTKNVKTLYITILEKNKPDDIEIEAEIRGHCVNVICDGCDAPIKGYRYKCISCADYDLCAKCEGCGIHNEHIMMRIPNGEMYLPRCARKFANHLARSMKKAHYFATKEAQRAAKYATKAQEKWNEKKDEEPKAGSSRHENDYAHPGAPMDDGFPFANIGEMARPFLQMFTSPNDGSNVNAAEFADNIRRVVYSFLERNSQAPTEEKTENPQNQSTNNQSADNQSTNNSSEKTFPNSTEMDVENEPQENENRNRDGRTENDWTFLGQNLEDTIRREDPKILEALQKLLEMGFAHEEYLLTLLRRFNGNVEAVIKHLFETEDNRTRFNF